MLPILNFDAVRISPCTVTAVLASRRWQSLMCTTDEECQTTGAVCSPIGGHWVSVCQIPPVSPRTRAPHSNEAFLLFVFAAAIFWLLELEWLNQNAAFVSKA